MGSFIISSPRSSSREREREGEREREREREGGREGGRVFDEDLREVKLRLWLSVGYRDYRALSFSLFSSFLFLSLSFSLFSFFFFFFPPPSSNITILSIHAGTLAFRRYADAIKA